MLNKDFVEEAQVAVKSMRLPERRLYKANFTKKYLKGSARNAEKVMHRSRISVQRGIDELESGVKYRDGRKESGRKTWLERVPGLEEDIREIAESKAQVDPTFKTEFVYIKITAKGVCKILEEKGYSGDRLPPERRMVDILNKLGYSLKRVLKKKPIKKNSRNGGNIGSSACGS